MLARQVVLLLGVSALANDWNKASLPLVLQARHLVSLLG